jgi:putative ABC transport system permease protein
VLPEGVEAITGTELTDERIDEIGSTFLDLLRTFLVAFAGIALVVATLSINNTFAITVAQRTRELALLRAVGASRRQIRAGVALEAALVGAVAAAIGCAAGLGVAGLLKGMFDAFGFALPAGGLTVQPPALIAGFAAGVLATVIAAQLPARRASAVAPLAALQGASTEATGFTAVRRWIAIGVLGAGLVAAGAGAATGSFVAAGLGGLALVVGALLAAPLAFTAVVRVLDRPLRRLGGAGLLAAQNARRNPRRSAATATALVIGVTVVSLFTLFTASLRATWNDEIRSDLTADLVVSTPSFGGGRLSPEIVTELRARPGVSTAVGLGGGPVQVDGRTTTAVATDLDRVSEVVSVGTVAGSLADLGANAIAVSRDEAQDRQWRIGSRVDLQFAGGASTTARVGAVFDENDQLGEVVLPSVLWTRHALQPTEGAVLVALEPGTTAAAARRTLAPIAQRFGGDLEDPEEYARSTTAAIDTLLNLVYVMLALAIVIALLGIANTLSLAVYERRTELGLLRAVGETRSQVRSMLRLESVVLAGFGTALGLVLGGVLGWVLFVTVSGSGTFTVPVGPIVVIAVLGAAAGVLAAVRPAHRAARLPVLDAIAAP